MAQDIQIADGLDFEHIVIAIEKSFELRFTDNAFAQVKTLGQLHEVIWARLADDASAGRKCATSMGFYRLKAYIAQSNPHRRLTPSTSLKSLANFDYPAMCQAFSGWHMPSTPITGMGCLVIIALTLGLNIPLAVYIGGWSILTGSISLIILTAALHRIFASPRPSETTLGDLARIFSAKNMRRLQAQGASLTSMSVWQTLITLIADEMDMDRNGLSRESRFI